MVNNCTVRLIAVMRSLRTNFLYLLLNPKPNGGKIIINKIKISVLSFVVTLISGNAALADQSGSNAANGPKPELVLGYIQPSDVGVSASGTAYGFSYSASYDWQFSDGIFAGIAYPTYSEDGGAEELLLGYGSLSYDKISGSGTATDGSTTVTISGSAAVDGDIKALAAVYSWKTSHQGPYLGGGVGGALVTDKINSVAGNSNISGSNSGLVPVGAFQAGFRTADSPDSKVNFDLSYRYMYFLSGSDGLDDLTANTFFLNITVPF